MSKLTDLEICMCIAEIEGHETTSDNLSKVKIESPFQALDGGVEQAEYNPLTDDGLCFRIMVKYKVEFMPSCHEIRPDKRERYGAYCVDGACVVMRSDSPNKAICLAIIESYKDNNNE